MHIYVCVRVCYLRCGRSTRAAQGSDRSVMDWSCSSGNLISDSTSSGTAGCSDVLLLNTLQEEREKTSLSYLEFTGLKKKQDI